MISNLHVGTYLSAKGCAVCLNWSAKSLYASGTKIWQLRCLLFFAGFFVPSENRLIWAQFFYFPKSSQVDVDIANPFPLAYKCMSLYFNQPSKWWVSQKRGKNVDLGRDPCTRKCGFDCRDDVPRRSAFLSVILQSNNGRASDHRPAMTRWCCYRRLCRRWLHLLWIEYHRALACLGLATGTICSCYWRRPRVNYYNAELICPMPPNISGRQRNLIP